MIWKIFFIPAAESCVLVPCMIRFTRSINPGPIRLVSGFAELFPGLFERMYPLFGANKLFAKVAKREGPDRI